MYVSMKLIIFSGDLEPNKSHDDIQDGIPSNWLIFVLEAIHAPIASRR